MSRENPFLDPEKYPKGTVLGHTRCAAKLTCGKQAKIVVTSAGGAMVKCSHCNDDLETCVTTIFFGKPETLAIAAKYDAAKIAPKSPKKELKDDGPTGKPARTGDNPAGDPENFGILI